MTMHVNRVYDDHWRSRPVWQDNAAHDAFLARPHRRPDTSHGHLRLARIPLHSAQTRLV